MEDCAWDASWEEPVCGAECSGLVHRVGGAALGRVLGDALKHDRDWQRGGARMPPGRGPGPGASGHICGRPAWPSGGCRGICGDWLWPQAWRVWAAHKAHGSPGGGGQGDEAQGDEAQGDEAQGDETRLQQQQRELAILGDVLAVVSPVGPHATQTRSESPPQALLCPQAFACAGLCPWSLHTLLPSLGHSSRA